jgi:hypothetical protein
MIQNNPQTMLALSCIFSGTLAFLYGLHIPGILGTVVGVVLLLKDFDF